VLSGIYNARYRARCARGAGASTSASDWSARRGPCGGRERLVYSRQFGLCTRLGAGVRDREDGRGVELIRQEGGCPSPWCRESGCRVLSTESENTRFPGCSVFRMSSTLDGKREHSFPRMRWTQDVEYSRLRLSTLNRYLGYCGRITRSWVTRTGQRSGVCESTLFYTRFRAD